MRTFLSYCQRNPQLAVGLIMFLALLLFWLIGPLVIDTDDARPMSAPPDLSPSAEYPLGTDSTGRQLLPVLQAKLNRLGWEVTSIRLKQGSLQR